MCFLCKYFKKYQHLFQKTKNSHVLSVRGLRGILQSYGIGIDKKAEGLTKDLLGRFWPAQVCASVLAGTILRIELIQSRGTTAGPYNGPFRSH
jgi:hypothetical protein